MVSLTSPAPFSCLGIIHLAGHSAVHCGGVADLSYLRELQEEHWRIVPRAADSDHLTFEHVLIPSADLFLCCAG